MYRRTNRYQIDHAGLTVVWYDEHGYPTDLNARGEPCADYADLAAFVRELHAQGAFDADTRDDLLMEVA